MVGVTGSIPVAPTICQSPRSRGLPGFSPSGDAHIMQAAALVRIGGACAAALACGGSNQAWM